MRNLASGGYKQPQQLLALNWVLVLGHPVDMVVNLDGFNDLVLGYTENLQSGVFPFYPRGWRWRVGNLDDPATQAGIARLLAARERRAALASRFRRSPLRHSGMARYLWIRADVMLEGKESRAEHELREARRSRDEGFAVVGPAFSGGRDAYLREAAKVWARSSAQIAALCEGSGIEYFHFLQPNQHDPGSKRIHPSEAARMARANPTLVELVEQGYPLFSAAGAELRSEGVRFFDLRRVFAGSDEPLYVDPCCHVGSRGNALLSEAIAGAVRSALHTREAPPAPAASSQPHRPQP